MTIGGVFLFMYDKEFDDPEYLAGLFGKAGVVPVITQLPGDLITPLGAFCALAELSDRSFLFESVEGGEHLARYSFIGSRPELSVRDTGGSLLVSKGSDSTSDARTILEFLRDHLGKREFPEVEGLPYFLGGAVGFLDFDVAKQIEPVLAGNGEDKEGFAGSEFMFFREVVAFDHVCQTVNIISLVFADEAEGSEERFRAMIDEANEKNRRTAEVLQQGPGRRMHPDSPAIYGGEFESNFLREDFERSVEEIKDLIRAGECYQVVLSQCFSRRTSAAPVEIYRALRSLNPSPYMFLMNFGGRSVIGASPEMLVRVRERHLEYRPIAGTRPRGIGPAEDSRLAEEMLADEKELAEHRMLVDLGRNDLGRVAEYGSVKVDELMFVEKFSHVQHIVSSVSARLRDGLDGFHALESCFPAGTVSGAPKVRAMEIIGELEPTERGVYSGAVGYIDYQGNLDTCIAIRTIFLEKEVVKIQAGAGIVADSVPSREFEETVHKAKGLMTAVEMAETGRFAIGNAAAAKEETA
jgi:anthranilate synthase component 1